MQFEACLLLWSCWTKTYRWSFSFFLTSADLSTCLNHQFWKTRKPCSALWNTFVCYNQSVQCKAIPISVTSSLALQMGNLKSDNHVQLSSWVCIIIHVQRVKSCQASRACQKISSRLLRFKTKPKPWPTPSNLFLLKVILRLHVQIYFSCTSQKLTHLLLFWLFFQILLWWFDDNHIIFGLHDACMYKWCCYRLFYISFQYK